MSGPAEPKPKPNPEQRRRRQRRRTLLHFRRLGEQLVSQDRSLTARERLDLEKAKLRLGLTKKKPPTIAGDGRSRPDSGSAPPGRPGR